MKRIIKSSLLVLAVAAIAGYATYSFFSDTETSTGNTFQAGAIDLTVEHKSSGPQSVCTIDNDFTSAGPIFSCNDVKPGDNGESTVKFTLQSNPAWACVYVSNVQDTDNTCTEPEVSSTDQECDNECSTPGCAATNGELDNALLLTVWIDDGVGTNGVACDNTINGTEDVLNPEGTLLSQLMQQVQGGTNFVIPVAVPNGLMLSDPIPAGVHCLGIKWEVPDGTGNDVQTDKLSGDLKFYVEQARNNGSFQCPTSI